MNAMQPVLAGNDGMVAIITILIMAASGVVNYMKEKRAEAKRRQELEQGTLGPDGERLQSEIDQFLSEVENAAKGKSTRKQQEAHELTDADVIDTRPAKRQRSDNLQGQTEAQRRAVAERHLQQSNVGQVSKRHVQSQVREHHLRSDVEKKHLTPERDLGLTGVPKDSMASSAKAVSPLAAMLRSPDGIRTAILLNEILSPPVSRRRK